MAKVLRVALVILVLAGIGVAVWRWQVGRSVVEVEYTTQALEQRRVSARITASGTLQAKVTVQVGAQVSGRIATLKVDFNSPVKKGDLIAKLDPQLFQAAVEQARANHASAKAGLSRSQAQERDAEMVLKRTEALAKESLAASSELQTAQTALSVARAGTEVAKATLAQSEASLHQAQVNLSYTDIFSPIDGTVISRSVDVGQTVAASLQAPVLFTIAEDLRRMQVHTNVAEADVGRLQPGMEATFTVDAFPGQRFRGRVDQIRNAAQTVQNVVTYDAVLDVDNGDLKLRPGMTATVTVVWAERPQVLAVPNGALRFRPPPEAAASFPPAPSAVISAARGPGMGGGGGAGPAPETSAGAVASSMPAGSPDGPRRGKRGSFGDPLESGGADRPVYVLKDGRPKVVVVRTGLSDGSFSEVVSGELAVGDAVITDVLVAGKPAGGAPSSTQTPRLGRMF